MQKYGTIAVFAGGPSSEREISLKSGRAVYQALKKRYQNVDFVDVDHNFRDTPHFLMKNVCPYNVVFLALHGRFGEDGTIQAMLEELNLTYTGSGVEASRLALDKIASRERFLANGISVPKYKVVQRNEDSKDLLKEFKMPFVVKPQSEGSSIGLTVVKEKQQLKGALEHAFLYGEKALAEEYIHGRELTVGILENQALPVIEIVARNKVYDFGAKYEDKETRYIVPARLKEDERKRAQDSALRAHNVLACRDLSRVDMRMDSDGNMYVLEVNTIPGMTERSLLPKAAQAAGIDFEDLCMRLVDLAYKRRRGRNEEEKTENRV